MSSTSASATCVAGVLVGGHSRRMGRPKALLRLADGRTFLEHVASVAGEVAGEVVLLGAAAQIPPGLTGLPTLPDQTPDAGPLAGLRSLLEYAGERWTLLLACDLPRLHADVLRRLLAAAPADADAAAFVCDAQRGIYHACCALYHPRLKPLALQELSAGRGSLQEVLRRARVIALDPDADEARQLENMNTPEDLARFGLCEW